MHTTLKRFFFLTAILALITALLPAGFNVQAGSPPPPTLTTLEPGGFRDIQQDLDINIVMIGFEPGAGFRDINEAALLGELPSSYRTVNRSPSFYFGNQFMGLTFDFNYNLVYADQAFEDMFFGYLASIATPMPLTIYQAAYNAQVTGSLDITSNSWIDAPSVEHWLHHNLHHELGMDPEEYTVAFINWYGRADFMFHVYTKTDEPDPDTGYNFGLLRDSRKLTAWGGTAPADEESGHAAGHGMNDGHEMHAHRLWFYDLSAGPEGWSDNWNLDADFGYTIPPIWEYGNLGAYRPFDNLSGDLGKVTRYVAIDLLFTTSPLYKPAISPPALPADIQLDINVYQMDPGSDGTDYFVPTLIASELNELQPLNSYSVELNSQAFDSRFEKVYNCFYWDVSCFGKRLSGIAFGDLFLYFNDHVINFLEGDADYEVPVFAFNATDELFTCCLGFADDDWATGTQSFVFAFDSPSVRDVSGYGFTTTVIHEVGHHIGMSHPHDGFDYEANVDFGPGGPYLFAWLGDMSNSMMSYIDLNWDFSQFDFDNMNRYMTSIYINQANVILADIYASPRAGRASSLLTTADNHAALALAAYAGMDYAGAALHASLAYGDVLAAAAQINVPVEPQSWQADYKAKGASGMFVDSVDYQRSKP